MSTEQPHPTGDLEAPRSASGTVATNTAVTNPGLEEHVERYTDAHPAAKRRVTAFVVFCFGVVAPVMSIAAIVAYFAIPTGTTINLGVGTFDAMHLALGLSCAIGLLAVGVGAEQWARQIMDDHEVVEERHPTASSQANREAIVEEIQAGVADSGVPRRKFLLASLGGAGLLVLPAVLTLSDMGPYPIAETRKKTLLRTIWAEGVRIVTDVSYRPIRASEMQIGELINAQPENLTELHGTEFQQAKAKCSLIVVKMDPNAIKIPDSRRDWHVDGILAYSKICTHVGCPVNLWERRTHHLLCPCHQSTFDLGDSGVVIFGPAARSLPQLPITVDREGYLIARSDFTVPVGPSFFERNSQSDYKEGGN